MHGSMMINYHKKWCCCNFFSCSFIPLRSKTTCKKLPQRRYRAERNLKISGGICPVGCSDSQKKIWIFLGFRDYPWMTTRFTLVTWKMSLSAWKPCTLKTFGAESQMLPLFKLFETIIFACHILSCYTFLNDH